MRQVLDVARNVCPFRRDVDIADFESTLYVTPLLLDRTISYVETSPIHGFSNHRLHVSTDVGVDLEEVVDDGGSRRIVRELPKDLGSSLSIVVTLESWSRDWYSCRLFDRS